MRTGPTTVPHPAPQPCLSHSTVEMSISSGSSADSLPTVLDIIEDFGMVRQAK